MFKKIFLLFFLSLPGILVISNPVFSGSMADIVFVVDESGSMSTEHAWIPGMAASLESDLTGSAISPNRYGLVGFGTSKHGGGSSQIPHQHLVGGAQFGTATQMAASASGLVTSGGKEDGWRAIEFALGYSFRSGAVRNIILVTDEDRDNTTSLSYTQVLNDINSQNAMLNVVVNAGFRNGASQTALGIDSAGYAYVADGSGGFIKTAGGVASFGFGSTLSDYVDLALATGGAAWDLNQLRLGGMTAHSFTDAFVNIKTNEITKKVPEPSLILLLGAGFLFLAFSRQKKQLG